MLANLVLIIVFHALVPQEDARHALVNFTFHNQLGNVIHVRLEHKHVRSHKYNNAYQDTILLILYVSTVCPTVEAAQMPLIALFAIWDIIYLLKELAFHVRLYLAQFVRVIAAPSVLTIDMALIA